MRPTRGTVRSAILQAASRHFLEVGYRAAKLETIAHLAGFTKGAIYSNFSSKQDLVLALVTERIASYTRRAEDALSQSSGPQQLLDVLASHLTDEVMEETAWHALMTELAVGTATDPALKELYRNIDDNLRSPRGRTPCRPQGYRMLFCDRTDRGD